MPWRHQACRARELALARERDQWEVEVVRLRKQLQDLTLAHQSATHALATRSQADVFSQMLGEAFQEVAGADPQFLTPDPKDREGTQES